MTFLLPTPSLRSAGVTRHLPLSLFLKCPLPTHVASKQDSLTFLSLCCRRFCSSPLSPVTLPLPSRLKESLIVRDATLLLPTRQHIGVRSKNYKLLGFRSDLDGVTLLWSPSKLHCLLAYDIALKAARDVGLIRQLMRRTYRERGLLSYDELSESEWDEVRSWVLAKFQHPYNGVFREDVESGMLCRNGMYTVMKNRKARKEFVSPMHAALAFDYELRKESDSLITGKLQLLNFPLPSDFHVWDQTGQISKSASKRPTLTYIGVSGDPSSSHFTATVSHPTPDGRGSVETVLPDRFISPREAAKRHDIYALQLWVGAGKEYSIPRTNFHYANYVDILDPVGSAQFEPPEPWAWQFGMPEIEPLRKVSKEEESTIIGKTTSEKAAESKKPPDLVTVAAGFQTPQTPKSEYAQSTLSERIGDVHDKTPPHHPPPPAVPTTTTATPTPTTRPVAVTVPPAKTPVAAAAAAGSARKSAIEKPGGVVVDREGMGEESEEEDWVWPEEETGDENTFRAVQMYRDGTYPHFRKKSPKVGVTSEIVEVKRVVGLGGRGASMYEVRINKIPVVHKAMERATLAARGFFISAVLGMDPFNYNLDHKDIYETLIHSSPERVVMWANEGVQNYTDHSSDGGGGGAPRPAGIVFSALTGKRFIAYGTDPHNVRYYGPLRQNEDPTRIIDDFTKRGIVPGAVSLRSPSDRGDRKKDEGDWDSLVEVLGQMKGPFDSASGAGRKKVKDNKSVDIRDTDRWFGLSILAELPRNLPENPPKKPPEQTPVIPAPEKSQHLKWKLVNWRVTLMHTNYPVDVRVFEMEGRYTAIGKNLNVVCNSRTELVQSLRLQRFEVSDADGNPIES